MNLAETQSLFWRALHARATPEEIDHCFTGTSELPAGERVEIYENMYLWRLVDALREDFPKTAALLGNDAFFAKMAAYIERYPSESPDIGDMGRLVGRFLSDQLDVRADTADLASLEWARAQVFSDAGREPLDASVLATIPPDDFPSSRLQMCPALRVLSFSRSPLAVWRAIEDGGPMPEPACDPGHAAVWRRGFEVFHASLAHFEADALRRALNGLPLAEVCDAFLGAEDAASAAFNAIASWFREGWVCGIE